MGCLWMALARRMGQLFRAGIFCCISSYRGGMAVMTAETQLTSRFILQRRTRIYVNALAQVEPREYHHITGENQLVLEATRTREQENGDSIPATYRPIS